jgi:hypothetical protein
MYIMYPIKMTHLNQSKKISRVVDEAIIAPGRHHIQKTAENLEDMFSKRLAESSPEVQAVSRGSSIDRDLTYAYILGKISFANDVLKAASEWMKKTKDRQIEVQGHSINVAWLCPYIYKARRR